MAAPPVVFISYSHDSAEHREQVLALSERLRDDGFETRLDQYVNGSPPEDWPRWMLNQFDDADWVLVVCTATYYRRFRGHEKHGGKGVTWEGELISQELYDNHCRNTRFLPVFLTAPNSTVVPEPLRGATFYPLTNEPEYQHLLDALHQVAGVEPRPVAEPSTRTRRQGQPLTFTDTAAASPYHVLPHTVSPHFQDPNNYLGQLHQRLTEGGPVAVVQAISGMGGLGKTQLALKYSADYRGDYPGGVWWFRAETAAELQIDAQRCCRQLGLTIADGEAPTQALKRGLEQQTVRWLLVYDNAEDLLALRPLLPQHCGHHILITSRNPVWKGLAQTLPLDTWTQEQGAAFLRHRLGAGDLAELADLSHDLGGLPLALEQAAGYLEAKQVDVATYRQRLAKVDTAERMLDFGQIATGYERSVVATLSLAYQELSPAARQLLGLCAYAAPEAIAERWFQQAAKALPSELQAAVTDPVTWDDTVGELHAYALADRIRIHDLDRALGVPTNKTEPALSLHRLTQAVARCRCADAAAALAWRDMLRHVCPDDASLPQHWPAYATLLPHIEVLLRDEQAQGLGFAPILWLVDKAALYLRFGRALYAQAEAMLRQNLTLASKHLGADDPDTLAIMNNLAGVLRTQGDLAGACQLEKLVWSIRREKMGEDHPDTLAATNNLANSLIALGHLADARALLEQLWAVGRRVLGGDGHPIVLTAMSNLATTLHDLGDLSGARSLRTEVLSIRRRDLGIEHPSTWIAMNNLASTLRAQADLTSARSLQEEVLMIQLRVLGREHPDSLTSMNNLAITLRDLGDLAGARIFEEQVLAVRQRILGDEHPYTLIAMSNLASGLRDLADIAGARALQEKVLTISCRVLGDEHPDTLMAMGNFASTLQAQGELAGARALQEKMLTTCCRKLGEDHPSTLICMANLAITLSAQGELTGAQALQERTLTASCLKLGEEHPNTLIAMSNLANTLWTQGDLNGARVLEERALAIHRRVMGNQHPSTLTYMNNLAYTLWQIGEYDAALPLMQAAAAGRLRVLGPDHPHTRGSQSDLAQMITALSGN